MNKIKILHFRSFSVKKVINIQKTKPITFLRMFLFLIVLFTSQKEPLCAQLSRQALIDSMLLELPNTKDDTSKVRLLNLISYNFPYINPDEGLKYGNEALQLAKKLSWIHGIADACSAIGGNYANKADYANAFKYEFEALKLYEQLKNKPKQAIMLRNLAIVFHTSKNQEKSLEYNAKAMAIYSELNDSKGIAAIYSNMANVYYTLRDMEKVLENNLKALKIYEELDEKHEIARLLGNIANFYAGEGDFGKAMPYYYNAIRKEKELGNDNGITRNIGNLGETYLEIAQIPPGKIKSDSLIPYGKEANLKKALEFLKTAIESAKELKQTEYFLAFGEVLSDAYKLSGKYHEALSTYKEYIAIRDSIYDVEKYNAATRRELNYEYGKRQDSIAFEKKITDIKLVDERKLRNREKIFYSTGIILVLVFSGFLTNRWYVTRKQKKLIEIEKKRSDELLLNILPAETAEELKQTGTAKAKYFDEVTVLFTDFENFTAMSEKLSAQELVNEINLSYSAFDKIITGHGIEKIKTIGDSYMCAGGLPVANKTNAVDTVKAALEMLDFMVSEKKKREADGKPFFEIRIGCHTGPVVAGIVGIKKFAYDIWGDTVNIASRMESAGVKGRVNISGTTYALLKDTFICEYRGKIQAKNKGEIDMYFVNSGG